MAHEPLKATSLSPSLTVNDLQRSLRFYTEGLGFQVESQHEVDGVVGFVMLTCGPGRLGIGQDDFAKGRDRAKGVGMRLWINTRQDVKALAQRAQQAGIALDREPSPLPWGPLAFDFTDPDGFKFTVVQES